VGLNCSLLDLVKVCSSMICTHLKRISVCSANFGVLYLKSVTVRVFHLFSVCRGFWHLANFFWWFYVNYNKSCQSERLLLKYTKPGESWHEIEQIQELYTLSIIASKVKLTTRLPCISCYVSSLLVITDGK